MCNSICGASRELVPPLLLMLAVYLLCSWLFRPPFSSALARAAIVLSYSSNYWYVFDPKGIEDLGHTWTLSTEEQFYILWPVIFGFLVRRLGVTWRLAMAIGAIGAAIWGWRICFCSRARSHCASIQRLIPALMP